MVRYFDRAATPSGPPSKSRASRPRPRQTSGASCHLAGTQNHPPAHSKSYGGTARPRCDLKEHFWFDHAPDHADAAELMAICARIPPFRPTAMRKDAISSCARGNEMSLFGSKQKTPDKGEATAKLRLDLAGAVSSARQAGIDSREIATSSNSTSISGARTMR